VFLSAVPPSGFCEHRSNCWQYRTSKIALRITALTALFAAAPVAVAVHYY